MSSTRIRVAGLKLELARRGWSYSDLAKAAGVSPATITSVMKTARASAATLRKMAGALAKQPILASADAFLDLDGAA